MGYVWFPTHCVNLRRNKTIKLRKSTNVKPAIGKHYINVNLNFSMVVEVAAESAIHEHCDCQHRSRFAHGEHTLKNVFYGTLLKNKEAWIFEVHPQIQCVFVLP